MSKELADQYCEQFKREYLKSRESESWSFIMERYESKMNKNK